MQQKTILFFDIDHTIYDPIKKSVSELTIKSFKELAKNPKIIIAIATGRAYYMLDIIDVLKPYIDIYITINGQIIIENNIVIHKEPLNKITINKVKTIFKKYNLIYGCIGETSQAINRLNERAAKMFSDASMPLPKINPDFDNKEAVYQMWAFADELTYNKINDSLKTCQLVPWLSDGFDVVLENQSKREGIIRVLNHYQVDKHNAYAFGDGQNDVEMLTYIPHSYAMGNATKYIKDKATYVTNHYNDDGVYNALIHAKLIDEERIK